MLFDTHCHVNDGATQKTVRPCSTGRPLPAWAHALPGDGYGNFSSVHRHGQGTRWPLCGCRYPSRRSGQGPGRRCRKAASMDTGGRKSRCRREVGLDYHWLDECPKDRQKEVFAAQLELARELSLPVVIHDREAHGDVLEFLQNIGPKAWSTASPAVGKPPRKF